MKRLMLFSTLFFLCFFWSEQVQAQCSISGSSSFTEGSLSNYSTGAVSGAGYFWSTTGVLNIVPPGNNTGSSVTVTSTSTGSGQICVTRYRANAAPCCTCRTITVTSTTGCIAPTGLQVFQFGSGCPGNSATFVALVTPSNATQTSNNFFWEAGFGNLGSVPYFTAYGGSSQSIPLPSTYASAWVRCTFFSPCGNNVNAFTLIEYEFPCNEGDFPFINEHSEQNQLSIANAQAAPNPFQDRTQLSLLVEKNLQGELVVHDLQGKLVFSSIVDLQKGENTIWIEDLPDEARGVLLYQLRTESEVLNLGKLLRTE